MPLRAQSLQPTASPRRGPLLDQYGSPLSRVSLQEFLLGHSCVVIRELENLAPGAAQPRMLRVPWSAHRAWFWTFVILRRTITPSNLFQTCPGICKSLINILFRLLQLAATADGPVIACDRYPKQKTRTLYSRKASETHMP